MLLYMKITLLQNCTLSYKIDCNSFHVLHTVLIISRSNPIIYHLLLAILLSLFIPLDINNLSYLKLLHQITISYLSANSKKNFVRHPENCYLLAIRGAIFHAILSFELFFCVLFVCYLYAICMLFACYQWVIPALFMGYYESVDSKKRAQE